MKSRRSSADFNFKLQCLLTFLLQIISINETWSWHLALIVDYTSRYDIKIIFKRLTKIYVISDYNLQEKTQVLILRVFLEIRYFYVGKRYDYKI